MAKHRRNEAFKITEVVKLVVDVEIAYDDPAARADAMRCAAELAEGVEIGGCGTNGRYNATKLSATTSTFDMNKVVSIVSGITYPHNMPTLFATLSDGSLWCATVVCDSSKSPNTYAAKWSRVDVEKV